MNSDPSHKFLGKTLTKIIRVIRKIGFTKSLDSTTIKPEKLGANIDKMAHDSPTIFS